MLNLNGTRFSPHEERWPMRIALSGPAGAGKTALANALSAELELPIVQEGLVPVYNARVAYTQMTKIGNATYSDVLRVFDQWKASYFRWCEDRALIYARHNSGFIADRWELDALGLWLHAFVQHDTFDETNRLRDIFMNRARSMDLVVVLPVGNFPAGETNEDGLRRNSIHNRSLLTQFSFTGMLSLMPASVKRYAPLQVEPVEKRMADIVAMLREPT